MGLKSDSPPGFRGSELFDFVLQAVTKHSHASFVQQLLGLPDLQRGLISIAFVNEGGVELIEEALQSVQTRVDAFVGIRNDVTSAQGLKRLIPLVSRLFVVDTGSRYRIFHPKIYLARSAATAHLLVGSANLTTGGLWNNIEASLKIAVDLRKSDGRAAVENLEAHFRALPVDYPQHVLRVTTDAEIDTMLDAGRVVDETVADRPEPKARGGNRGADTVPRMLLPLSIKRPRVQQRRRGPRRAGRARKPGLGAATPGTRSGYELIWESKALTERDLNIPSGPNTARTGSMLFKRGRLDDIDQRHFFRNAVFGGLDWQPDARPNRRHLERAQALFKLIIKNLDYGEFELRLSHNTDTTSRAYEQRNAMTQVHWGEAAGLVRHRDLLGRTLYLYRDSTRSDHFIIEID